MAISRCCSANLIEECTIHNKTRNFSYACVRCNKPTVPEPNINEIILTEENGLTRTVRYPNKPSIIRGRKYKYIEVGRPDPHTDFFNYTKWKNYILMTVQPLNANFIPESIFIELHSNRGAYLQHRPFKPLSAITNYYTINRITVTADVRDWCNDESIPPREHKARRAWYEELVDFITNNDFIPDLTSSNAKVQYVQTEPVPEPSMQGTKLPDPYSFASFAPGIKDEEVLASGGTQFSTGAVRSGDKAGVMYHLITPIGLRRIAETYKEGFDKYGAYNWERGMPIGDILNHAIAHIYAYLEGKPTGEDDLAHAAWNLLAAMHMEETHPGLDHQLRPNHTLNNHETKTDK